MKKAEMPEESTSERLPTGDDIIAEILRNSEAGQFKIRQTALIPSIYHVYLHPGDYDSIRTVIPALTAEARSALIERMEDLNRREQPSKVARVLGFESSRPVAYKILDPDWTIEFQPDLENKLKRGDIEVYSELASAPQPDFEGAMTRHVTRKRADGEQTSYSATASTQAVSRPGPEGVLARIRYADASGPKTFEVTKNQVVIGRGGKTFWVDVKIEAPADVSREHCRIRHDPATGQFFIKDVSQFGTAVNGRSVPSSIERHGGEERDRNIETPLPAKSTISLAGVFTLEFEAAEK